jgi:agmatine/peptidylarginine deiminase
MAVITKMGRFLPEWAPVRAVLLAWPYPRGDWEGNYDQVAACYWGILTALSAEVEVWLLLHHSLDAEAFRLEMQQRLTKTSTVQLIADAVYDDTWIRDYGPLSIDTGYIAFTFNGWGGKYSAQNDNQVAQFLAPRMAGQFTKYEFVCEGGGLETNGDTLLLNADCIVDEARNPGWDRNRIELFFAEVLGHSRFAWVENVCLSGDDTDGHIDTIARFADAHTLIYAGPNPQHADAASLQHLHQQIQGLAREHDWLTFALPSPQYHSLIDGRLLPCTYANFLIANQVVFAPVYGLAEDAAAVAVLREAFPKYKVIEVRCEALLEQHGSLHCATMQLARLV